MTRRLQSISLLFLIPGVLLVILSFYIPFEYVYKQLLWTRTEARFVERIIHEDRPDAAYSILEFTDTSGVLHKIKEADENTWVEGKDDQHFILYYEPTNPKAYVMMNHGRYLLILFFPFGVLLCFLGWPEKGSKTTPGIPAGQKTWLQK